MRGIVIVEGRDEVEGHVSMLWATYHNGEMGLIEAEELPERGDLFAHWLLSGILSCTGVVMVSALPWVARVTNEQLVEEGMIGEDTQVFRLTLTTTQMALMRYHFNLISSGTAASMMRELPSYIELPGKFHTVLRGEFTLVSRLTNDRLRRRLGDELAQIVLRQR